MTLSPNLLDYLQSAAFDRQQAKILEEIIDYFSGLTDGAYAPIGASYIVLAANTDLTNERIATAGTGINFVDAGAGSTWTISVTLAPFDTDDLAEGVTNLYFTNERAQDAVGGMVDTTLEYDDATPYLRRAAISGDITIAAGSNTAAITSGVIVNTDINGSAAIAHSKMAALTASRAMVTDGSGFASVATTTATEIGYVSGVTSAIQTQLDGKQPLDATLTALAAANWAANSLAIGSGTDTVAQVTFAANTFPARSSTGNLVAKAVTDYALTILDDPDAGTARGTLGLGTAAVKNTGTSGNNVPLLDGANTWSASQSINANVTFDTLTDRSIGWGGNTSAAAANPLIYSDGNYIVVNSKAGSPLYLNFDNSNASSTVNFFNGKMVVQQGGNVGILTTGPSTTLHVNGPARVGSYTVATVPSASSSGAGAIIYVSDETGGAVLAFSDATNWRRVTDRAVVS